MSQWIQVQNLEQSQFSEIKVFYDTKLFPIEIRALIPDWIEVNLSNVGPNLSPEEIIKLLDRMFSEITLNGTNINDPDNKIYNFTWNFQCLDKIQLFMDLKECLAFEGSVISKYQPYGGISHRLSSVASNVTQLEVILDQQISHENVLKSKKTRLTEIYKHLSTQYDFLLAGEKESLESELIQMSEIKQNNLGALTRGFTSTIEDLAYILEFLISDALADIRFMQQFIGNDIANTDIRGEDGPNSPQDQASQAPNFSNSATQTLQEIQKLKERVQIWFEEIYRILLKLLDQFGKGAGIIEFFDKDIIAQFHPKVMDLMESLIGRSLIVYSQPESVLKKGKIVKASIWLILGNVLNFVSNPIGSPCSVFNELQLEGFLGLMKNGVIPKSNWDKVANLEKCGNLFPSQGSTGKKNSEFVKDGTQLIAQKDAQISSIIRKKRRSGGDRVTDEKYILLYSTSIEINLLGVNMPYKMWALSLPVGITVGAGQGFATYSSMFWDYAFRPKGMYSIKWPNSSVGPWDQLAFMLSQKFEVATGRGLTPQNLQNLSTKFPQNISQGKLIVTYEDFCKNSLNGRDFTFFEWWHGALRLTRQHLMKPWAENRIIGFIDRISAENTLRQSPPGHFLLRFSDSCRDGGISWTYVKNESSINACDPYTSEELKAKPLSHEINSISILTHLYPNIPKAKAFQIQLQGKSGYDKKDSFQRVALDCSDTNNASPTNASEEISVPEIVQNQPQISTFLQFPSREFSQQPYNSTSAPESANYHDPFSPIYLNL